MSAVPTTLPAIPALADQGLDLSPDDFDRVRRLIRERAGISLHDGKRAMVHGRLSRRLRVTGHRSFGEYLQSLDRDPGSAEWQAFVNSLTTNLTSFFREEHYFLDLADDLRARAASRSSRCGRRPGPSARPDPTNPIRSG